MITYEQARSIIADLLSSRGQRIEGGLTVIEDKTLTKPYGWIFFYNSRLFLETMNVLHGIAGNGPLVVLASTGELVMLGTARPAMEEIAAFERGRSLQQ